MYIQTNSNTDMNVQTKANAIPIIMILSKQMMTEKDGGH